MFRGTSKHAHFTLPPGKYFIGDPCYVFDNPSWDLLQELDGFLDGEIVTLQDRQLWAHSTAHGDGTYPDQNGSEYSVDSGMLGAVPIELIEDPSGEEHGTMVDAPNGLIVEYDNGTFWFGAIVIKTDDVDSDDDAGYGDDDPEEINFD